jgi:SprT protein
MQLPYLGTKKRSTPFSLAENSCLIVADLHSFLPENSTGYIQKWFKENIVHLRISKARSSKLGDYRAPINHFPARISVNRNLNKFDFLITLVHEMAHHKVYTENYIPDYSFTFHRRKGWRPRPHGKEWKENYRELMSPLLTESIFPSEILQHLIDHFKNPGSSSKSNKHLVLELKNYDTSDDSVFIESLPFDTIFTLPAGRKFMKKEKLRKRYRCICLDNERNYLFSPVARVLPLLS